MKGSDGAYERTILPAMVHALKHVNTAAALGHGRCLVPAHLRIRKHDAHEALCFAAVAPQHFEYSKACNPSASI